MPPSCHRRAPCVRFRSAASPAGFTLGGSSKYRAITSIHPGWVVGGSRGATGVNPTDGMGTAPTFHPLRSAGQGADVGQHRRRNPPLPSGEGARASLRKERRSVRLVSEEVRASRAPPPAAGSVGAVFLGSAQGEPRAVVATARSSTRPRPHWQRYRHCRHCLHWPPGRCRCGTGRPQG